MRHLIGKYVEGRNVLSGQGAGRRLLTEIIEATPSVDLPTPVFLDFAGIDVATSSFLREVVIGFRDYALKALDYVYPVVANASPSVLEELDFFVRTRGDALWVCDLDEHGLVIDARIIGELEPPHRATLDKVIELGAATAPELAAHYPAERIGSTAWNNRLSALATKGLIVEFRQGKAKSFRPLLRGV